MDLHRQDVGADEQAVCWNSERPSVSRGGDTRGGQVRVIDRAICHVQPINLHTVEIEDSAVINNGMQVELQAACTAVKNKLAAEVPGEKPAVWARERKLGVLGCGQD